MDIITTFMGEYKPYDNGSYKFVDKARVLDANKNLKHCVPFDDISLLGYSKVVHWSLIENCMESLPRFYCIYPYVRQEINEFIFMRDTLSRDFTDSYKYYDEGDLIAFTDGIWQYVNPLLGILPVANLSVTDEIFERIYAMS